jgi:hypothetical protein
MPEQILDLDVERAISDVTRRKHADMLQFLYMIDTYGLTEVAKWLHRVKQDLSGSRLAVGTALDPRR